MKKALFTVLSLFVFSSFLQSQTVYEWYQDGIVVFQLKPNAKYIIPSNNQMVNLQEVDFLNRLSNDYGIYEGYQFFPDYTDEKLKNTYQIKFTEIDRVDVLIRQISQLPFIEYAEKKELHVKFLTPNDLGANATTGTGMWHLYTMEAQQAWDLSTGSASVIVAITDDAIKIDHPDLVNKVVTGNDVTDQNSTSPLPCGGNDGNHGTHVSGTVGAETNNGLGVSSIGYGVSIMPVKIGRCSDGALTGGFEGVAWAANNGADVINMSWGGGGASTFGQNVMDNATTQGAILVAAAGNDGTNQQFYPAAYNNVVSVASTTNTDAKSGFSQYGTWIDISAPGSAIRSTWADDTYARIQGTSMASPNVAGLLGLMKSYAPNATNADLISCLYSSADPVTTFITEMGAGRINAFAAMQCAGNFAFTTDAGISEIIAPSGNICGSDFTPQIRLRNFGSNPITSLPITWEWNGTPTTFTWTGNLTTGQTEIITLPLQIATGGNYTFTATANLAGDQNAGNNSTAEAFTMDPSGQEIDLTIITDCYGSEITWSIEDDNGVTILTGGPFANVTGGETLVNSYCLPVGCYTFNIADSYGDGMYGSQWNGCTVNGDYSAETSTGIPLFQMTAANADFGTATSHDFCLTAIGILNDAGITEILEPSGTICGTQITPQVRIQNYGSDVLTSAVINYSAGGAAQTLNWTGNLTTGQNELVTLPVITANAGAIIFEAFTTLPNALSDDDASNDLEQVNVTIFSGGLSLPFVESFESNSFNTNLWTLVNPDNDITWDLVTTAGNLPGSTAARMNFYNYTQTSQRDGLISPLLDLNGYSSVDMDFEHAYRRFIVAGTNQPAPTDSLIIAISSDCGSSWQRVLELGEDGTGSMATNVTSNQAFTPQTVEDWCLQQVLVNGNLVGANCFSVNLDAFIGQEIFVRFEGFNAGTQGNNLFIDNINITGVPIAVSLDAGISDILNPTSICGASIDPMIEISNFGSTTLTSATIEYQWNGGGTQTFNWTGNLSSGQSDVITLPTENLIIGNNTLAVNTTLPNGQADQNTANDAQSIVIVGTAIAAPSTSIPVQICSGTNETLTATAMSGGIISWYDDALGLNLLSNTANLTVNLPANNYTYYVQEVIDTTTQNVGPNNFFTGAFFANTDRFLYFDALDDVVIKSVQVNADAAGNRTIQLRDNNGVVLQQLIVNIPAGISRVDLNFTVAPGTNYQLGLGAGINGLWRTNDPANIQYPYTVNGLISIVESDVGVDFNPPTTNTYYYSFYDWEVARPYCESDLAPVNFTVESCTSAPTADFSANTTSICLGESVNFTDLSTETPTAWSWTFTGGTPNSSSLQNPSVIYNIAGTYTVSLTATNATGSDTETKTAYITVNDLPAVTITGNNSYCAGGSSILTANTFGASVSTYQWYLNGNTIGTSSANLTASQVGNYTVEVTDANGCMNTSAVFNLIENTNPTASISGTSSFCIGGNTVLTASTTGANIFSYQWKRNGNNVGVSGNSYTAQSGGNYTVEVTDMNGCSATSAVFIVTENALPVVSIVGNNSFCSGSNSLLTASTSGANIASYQWQLNGNNVGTNTGSFNATQGGNYTVEVVDLNGCIATSLVFIVTENANPTAAISGNTNLCGTSATVLTVTTSGAAIATYQWKLNGNNVGNNSATYSTLQAGGFTVDVTDINGCTATSSLFVVNSASLLVIDITTTPTGCGLTNGTASVTVDGTTTGFTFEWNTVPIQSGSSISNLGIGNYMVTITEDATGCQDSQTFMIGNANAPVIDSVVVEHPNCTDSLGAATAYVSGGDGNYTYNWGAGLPNAPNSGDLMSGSYVLEVTDGQGCVTQQNFTINAISAISITANAVVDATCANVNDGSIDLSISGGDGNYMITWSNNETTEDLNGLNAGMYTIDVTDNNGCAANATYTLGNSYQLGVDLTATNQASNGGDASIIAVPSNGVAPYSYSWNNGAFTGEEIENLTPGEYFVTVSDGNGCSVLSDTVIIGTSTVAISDLELLASIEISPNPTNGNINIIGNKLTGNELQVAIYNTLGQVILSKTILHQGSVNEPISMDNVAAGVYRVLITSEKKQAVWPVVKME